MAATLRNFRYVRSAQASNAPGALLHGARFVRNMVFGGAYRIHGTVTELGVAGSYQVLLFDRRTGMLLGETWSAADGSYEFPYIAQYPNNSLNGYFVVLFDHGDNPLNAAIADLVTPELMP